MDLVKKKVMFSIVSAAMGLSLLLTPYSFAGNSNNSPDDKNEKISIKENTELSAASISQVEAQKLSSPPAEAETKAASPFTGKFVVNISEYLNVRSQPDPGSEIVGKLYSGSGGDVLEKGAEWTKISSGNVVGYIDNQYAAFDEAAEALANQICPWLAAVNTETLKVRKEASAESGVLGLVSAGETFTVTSTLAGWAAVDYSGSTGYLSADYITLTQKIGTGITIAEEEAAIKAEQERLAAIEAEKQKAEQKKQSKIQQAAKSSQLVSVVQNSPYNVSEEDAYLLACLVTSEAGSECYEGKLAVANIVLNRLNGRSYGSTISDVIYAKGQFTVVSSGILTNKLSSGPNGDSLKAAKEALSGTNNVPNYTGFCTQKAANYNSYKAYSIIGNQVFYRK